MDGDSLNVVGLSGSRRSESLQLLSDHLEQGGWQVMRWNAERLEALDRRAIKGMVEQLQGSSSLSVIVIDDFGDYLVGDDGQWLERLLFSAVHEAPNNEGEFLRCVLSTYPRDREIVGPGSVLRERAKVIPPRPPGPPSGAVTVGGASGIDIEVLCGSCRHLLSNVTDEAALKGNAMQRAISLLPLWIGQLDGAQQRRLGAVLRRTSPARWRDDDFDPYLRPLIVRADSKCFVPAAVVPNQVIRLLLSERWPEEDVDSSARRFAARCGNEPSPLWADNYLSDLRVLDARRLVAFLQRTVSLCSGRGRLRLLSRNRVGGRRIMPSEIRQAMNDAGMTRELWSAVEWRLYDQHAGVNLHRRELLLPRRGTGFSLPTAQMIVGQLPLGNESDAEILLPASQLTMRAWHSGTSVRERGDR